ncbi:hypothetical protein HDU85_001353 [Gaertneriomyces sp. JEL0708]|nr:hypothetical protein HDU85_001353 [Gaertneriomyces sp. JEL0708]
MMSRDKGIQPALVSPGGAPVKKDKDEPVRPTSKALRSPNPATPLPSIVPRSTPPGAAAVATPVVKFRTGMRNTVYDAMRDRGWKDTDGDDWDFFWADVHWVHEMLDHVYLSEGQRINHFRNHYELTRKDLLLKNLKRLTREILKSHGKAESAKFEFLPPAYVLPGEHALFAEEFKKNPGSVWIMKPVGKAQGKGIFLINKISMINGWKKDVKGVVGGGEEVEAYIVQRYIERPLLIGGKKFDIRIYVLVTSYYPLTIYVHRNGFCRFSNSQFSMQAKDISNLYIHATNVAIQKHSPNYISGRGCKWLLRNLRLYLNTKHGKGRVDDLFTEMEALIVRSLMSVQKVMINDKHCFELYGYDVLIDDDLKPWLLEVNASPSLTAETQFDYDLKHAMLQDAFDLIDMEKRFPPKTVRQKVGGFDLVYCEGSVRQEGRGRYASYLGCYHPIPKAPRTKKRFKDKESKAPSSSQEPIDNV